jgi:hypothetical protein
MFSDEKLFTVNGGQNRQNNRVYAYSREEADKMNGLEGLVKFPLSIMVWVGLTENGSTGAYFIPKGKTLDAEFYCRRILPFAKRKGNELFGTREWVFQQDGATAHTSNRAQGWCERNLNSFLEKNHWPPNSPDLNPLDYFFWNEVVTKMNVNHSMTLDEFQEEISRAIAEVPVDMIKKAVNRFTYRVRKVEEAKGGRAKLT